MSNILENFEWLDIDFNMYKDHIKDDIIVLYLARLYIDFIKE